MDAAGVGQAQRGAGAWLRAKVERVQAQLSTDPLGAREAADLLLADLQARRGDPADALEPDTLEEVAATVIAVRNAAIEALRPARGGAAEAFIHSVADGAVWSDWRWGVPSSVTLAQAILESDWGRSAPANNLFGLKGEGPAGSVVRRVVEYRHGRRSHKQAAFRAYTDPGEAVRDHGRILGENRRYAKARAVSEDLSAYTRALTGTYATDPRYGAKLLRLIEARGLDRYDWATPAPRQ